MADCRAPGTNRRLKVIADGAFGEDVTGDTVRIDREIGGDPNTLPIIARLQIAIHMAIWKSREGVHRFATSESSGMANPGLRIRSHRGSNQRGRGKPSRVGRFQPVLEHDAAALIGLVEQSGSRHNSETTARHWRFPVRLVVNRRLGGRHCAINDTRSHTRPPIFNGSWDLRRSPEATDENPATALREALHRAGKCAASRRRPKPAS